MFHAGRIRQEMVALELLRGNVTTGYRPFADDVAAIAIRRWTGEWWRLHPDAEGGWRLAYCSRAQHLGVVAVVIRRLRSEHVSGMHGRHLVNGSETSATSNAKFPRKHFLDTVDGLIGNAGKHLAQIGFRIKAVEFR